MTHLRRYWPAYLCPVIIALCVGLFIGLVLRWGIADAVGIGVLALGWTALGELEPLILEALIEGL